MQEAPLELRRRLTAAVKTLLSGAIRARPLVANLLLSAAVAIKILLSEPVRILLLVEVSNKVVDHLAAEAEEIKAEANLRASSSRKETAVTEQIVASHMLRQPLVVVDLIIIPLEDLEDNELESRNRYSKSLQLVPLVS